MTKSELSTMNEEKILAVVSKASENSIMFRRRGLFVSSPDPTQLDSVSHDCTW